MKGFKAPQRRPLRSYEAPQSVKKKFKWIFILIQVSEMHGAGRVKPLALDKSGFGPVKDFSNQFGI